MFVIKDGVTKAEILWCLKSVMNHYSMNSCNNVSTLFKRMFTDSIIAQQISIGPTKAAYTIAYGLAPYFKNSVLKKVGSCKSIVVAFDESLNKISQREQMDLVVRYWDDDLHAVSVRYLRSVFMGHTRAEDLVAKFKEGLGMKTIDHVLQVSMDGPNVNWKMLDLLNMEATHRLCETGSCGLHVVSGAFHTGHTAAGWNVSGVLRAMHQLFKDSPARRADFTSQTEVNKFPLKFCTTRWLENVRPANRALELYPVVVTFVRTNKKLPSTNTCETLREASQDKLTAAKISFSASVAGILEPFLEKFQTRTPMFPLLYNSLLTIVRSLMSRFVKKSILEEANTSKKRCKIDLTNKDNLCDPSKVDIGVATKKLMSESKATERAKFNYAEECQLFLKALVQKMLQQSPLKYRIVKAASCLDPEVILQVGKTTCETRFSDLVECLHETNHLNASVAHSSKIEYADFCRVAINNKKFQEFYHNSDRLDQIYYESVALRPEKQNLWEVCKLVFILSHGNASVERGFSVNKAMLVENQHEESLVAHRLVYDSVSVAGGMFEVEINSKVLNSVRMARGRYEEALLKRRETQSKEERAKAEKRKIDAEVKALEEKRKCLEQNVKKSLAAIGTEIEALKKGKFK